MLPLSRLVVRVFNSFFDTVEYMQKKRKGSSFVRGDFSCAGTALFFQAVTRQVSSALMSLTSVFGMGTGGTSSPLAPAIQLKSLRV